ncbi:MAG: hypothetical protein M3Q49_00995 [Actinomycetota bacterium]|jgi:hypothetical protein|nr:hypothetical protein [Actinomycetota bacterium]PLS87249.1 MAG: hypothetical protein CYG60_02930 [Actinomycetota bacterium]
MGILKSAAAENPDPRTIGAGRQGTPTAAAEISEAAAHVRVVGRSQGRRPRPSEVPPSGELTGVLGEMAFYYGACWLHYRAARRRG